MKTDPVNAASLDRHAWLARLLDQSYLIKAYKKLLFVNLRPLVVRPATADEAGSAARFDDFVPVRYRANLEAMVRLLASHDVKALLVTLPTVVRPGMTSEEVQRANVFFPYFAGAYGIAPLLSLHRAYNRAIVDVGRQEQVEVVDLAAQFERVPERTVYFWDTMHPNEKGGSLIADVLAARLAILDSEGRL
jgi:lysophospholipase L1-like esterase